MKIEQIDISLLKPYENNAKIHTEEQIEQIQQSIEEFGNNDPIAIDENNVIIEGHGRLIALKALGYKKVDVIRLTHLTEEQKKAYILVHNKLTMNTGFDEDILAEELGSIKGIDMSQFEFDVDFSIDSNMNFEDDNTEDTNSQYEVVTKQGDLWQLGSHRLYVGDSTSQSDVDILLGGQTMDLCVTDPPYNVNYGDKAEMLDIYEKGHKNKSHIMNDNMDSTSFFLFLRDFYIQMLRSLKPGGGFYIFHAETEGLNFRGALEDAGGTARQTLIWVKNALVLGRQDYQWKHEPFLYGWKEGAGHYFVDDRTQTTVFESRPNIDDLNYEELTEYAKKLQEYIDNQNTTVIRENKPKINDLHPTMKPVPLIKRLIQNSSKRGENVIDFFGGSGTTLIACEELGRNAFLMELDPLYASQIIGRFEAETGQQAVKLN